MCLVGIDPFAAQREAAQRAKFARQSGALQAGGLRGAGIAQQNQAGLITQAGLGNRAFTPQAGATTAVGQGIQGAQQAEAQYQNELGRIAEAERQAATAGQQDINISITQRMIKVLEQANPHLASPRPLAQNRGGVVYRQDGGDITEPAPAAAANLDASISNTHPGIAKFVSYD